MARYRDQNIVVGNDVSFTLEVKKDGVVWDISSASVLFYLRDPDGNWSTAYTATVTDGPGGVAVYNAAETVIDQEGSWMKQWEITKDDITLRTEAEAFTVEPWQPEC